MLAVITACFALYGALLLIWQVWHRFMRPNAAYLPAVIVVVEQSDEWIEWFIRKLSLELYALGKEVLDILIVDTSASLETSLIVSRLQQSYHFITYVPSAKDRKWSDVEALLQTARQPQTLLIELHDKSDVHQAVHMISQLRPR